MPCYFTGSAEGDAALEAEYAREEVTKLTEFLCRLCKLCSLCEDMDNFMPPDIKEWWEKHRYMDIEKTHEDWKATLGAKEKRVSDVIETCLKDFVADKNDEIYDYIETNLSQIMEEMDG